ncbi:hypothetical protein MPP7335_03373 [Mycolicibacterium parafortuitum]|uniref:Uncharacterized protein n=1 Tax=Mycolicibacterium parafortuitum TaxID=39692 RepID=A0A375YKD0_MYCPF|nr:hypothetical protein BST38_25860 [Mycolicibacterium parafortuitum]SRX81617.1 hypothetical protein MPP7335_03373 [Mycolicibacterium parafortuitum]
MGVIRRSRSLARRGVKVQRRIAFAQLLFWPVLVVTLGGIGIGVVAAVRSQSSAAEGLRPDPLVPNPPVNR